LYEWWGGGNCQQTRGHIQQLYRIDPCMHVREHRCNLVYAKEKTPPVLLGHDPRPLTSTTTLLCLPFFFIPTTSVSLLGYFSVLSSLSTTVLSASTFSTATPTPSTSLVASAAESSTSSFPSPSSQSLGLTTFTETPFSFE
jgi:hypothetical protein